MSARSESNAGKSVVGSTLLVLLLSSVLVPTVLTARSVASAVSAVTVVNCHDSGAGSLRRAVDDATAGTTIGFGGKRQCPTITLASTITIRRPVTIEGPGARALVVSGNDAVQVFHVDPGVTASITGLTVAHGNGPYGGGIDNNGTLTLADSRVTANTADTGGGGIWNNGRLSVEHSTLTGNQCGYFGGGIYSGPRGTLHVVDSTLSGNSAVDNGIEDPEYAYGGAIYADGTATISDTSLTGNRTQSIGGGGGGGALYVGGAATVTGSTMTGNSVTVIVAAIPGEGGGAILNSGALDVVATTVSDNTTDVDGGGIDNGWHLHLRGSTVTGNTAPTGPDIYDSPASTTT